MAAIPDKAVEAAAEALCRAVWNTTWEMVDESQRYVFRDDARKALEAAAPHMIPEAAVEANAEVARLLLKDAFTLQSQPGMKEICQHLTDAAIALDECARG
jgi:hypothetical protein